MQKKNIHTFFIGVMNKYIVISTNDNEDYLHYLPIVIDSWNRLGWLVICFYKGICKSFDYIDTSKNRIVYLNKDTNYREATLVQVSRLFAGCLDIEDDSYVMTSDVDMLPCSDYWYYNEEDITVWGYDLTDYTEYPICYIGMKASAWRKVMSLSKNENDVQQIIENFLDNCPNAKSDDFYKWWGVDQQEITKLLMQENIVIKTRGKLGDYAQGRVDRGNWNSTLEQSHYIDAHLPRPSKSHDSIEKVKHLLIKLNTKPEWYEEYTNQKTKTN